MNTQKTVFRPAKFRQPLLRWYRANHRDLPWRRTKDPYAIWISEIMCQQTRVEAVIPYYQKFLRRFPDVESLASAQTDEVLALWSGLGYYARARSLHSAARDVASRFGGELPQDEERIRSLPGFGPYTAGAVLSIAFDNPVPLVDGNVIRLLSRVFGIHGDTTKKPTRDKIWDIARSLVPKKSPGEFNQALMELPALVCAPRSPRCGECPLERICLARVQKIQHLLPEKKARETPIPLDLSYACIEKRGRFLLVRREENPMRGMWEFPRLASVKAKEFSPLGEKRHSIMRWRIRARYFSAREAIAPSGGRWVAREEIAVMPVTTLTKKGLALLAPRD